MVDREQDREKQKVAALVNQHWHAVDSLEKQKVEAEAAHEEQDDFFLPMPLAKPLQPATESLCLERLIDLNFGGRNSLPFAALERCSGSRIHGTSSHFIRRGNEDGTGYRLRRSHWLLPQAESPRRRQAATCERAQGRTAPCASSNGMSHVVAPNQSNRAEGYARSSVPQSLVVSQASVGSDSGSADHFLRRRPPDERCRARGSHVVHHRDRAVHQRRPHVVGSARPIGS